MNYNKIRKTDISNGEGVRVSIFVQGCTFNCPRCFNPETHDFLGGKEFSKNTMSILMDLCSKDYIEGLSILGGEPLHSKNISEVKDIVLEFKKNYPNKTIWIWTGFTYENLLKNKDANVIFENIDYLVDGLFKEKLKNFKLKWRGSENQRVIDMKSTLKFKRIIEKS